MSEQLQKSSDLATANFDSFIGNRTQQVRVKVFLCGKALIANASIQEQAESDLRAYLLMRLEGEIGCHVFLGEHNQLIKTYHVAAGFDLPISGNPDDANLALFEASLADYADLIVIFPDSPGSFAELGMFSMAPGLCTKLLLVIKAKYQGAISFINRGPIVQAQNNRAQVAYLDYEDREAIYGLLRNEIHKIRETLVSQTLWQRKTHK